MKAEKLAIRPWLICQYNQNTFYLLCIKIYNKDFHVTCFMFYIFTHVCMLQAPSYFVLCTFLIIKRLSTLYDLITTPQECHNSHLSCGYRVCRRVAFRSFFFFISPHIFAQLELAVLLTMTELNLVQAAMCVQCTLLVLFVCLFLTEQA